MEQNGNQNNKKTQQSGKKLWNLRSSYFHSFSDLEEKSESVSYSRFKILEFRLIFSLKNLNEILNGS